MPKADTPNNKGKKVNKYPPRPPLTKAECQRVVDMRNKIRASDNKIKERQKRIGKVLSVATCVFIHENGDVSVGISGSPQGNYYTKRYAEKLEAALNKEAGKKKYTVSYVADSELISSQRKWKKGRKPGECAEPKAATAAHKNESPIVGMDVRYFSTENVPHRLYEGSNQMRPCDTCAHYEEEIMAYANANANV